MSFSIFNPQIPVFNNASDSGVTLKSTSSNDSNFVVKRLKAGTNITLTETGTAVTIAAAGGGGGVTSIASAGGTNTLVASGSAPVPTIKGLTPGAGISMTPSGTDVTIAVTGVVTAVNPSGTGNSMVASSSAPIPTIKGLSAGTAISITNNANNLVINNSGVTSITTSGVGNSLVENGSAPTPIIKGLSAGNAIGITDNGTDLIIINNGVTSVSNTGAGTVALVATSAAPNPTIKGLTSGSNITLTDNGNDITIASSSGTSTDVENSSSSVSGSQPLVSNPNGNPVYIAQIGSSNGSVSIAQTGSFGSSNYCLDLTTSGGGGGVQFTPIGTGITPALIAPTTTTTSLTIQTLAAGTGISISTDGSTTTISNTGGGTTDVQNSGAGGEPPYYPVVQQTGTGTVLIKELTSSNSSVSISDGGSYLDLTVAGGGSGVQFNGSGGGIYIIQPTGTTATSFSIDTLAVTSGLTISSSAGTTTISPDIQSVGNGNSTPNSAATLFDNYRVKTINVTNNNSGVGAIGLTITDDGSGSGNIVINLSLT